jgi:hypothetical protein
MSTRQAAFRIFIGTNGTGKTTTMKKYLAINERNLVVPSSRDDTAWHGLPELAWEVRQMPDAFTGKLIPTVVFPEINTFTGTRVVHVDGDERIFNGIIHRSRGIKNAGLFLDDFRMYIYSKGSITKEANNLFIGRRHRMLDVFMACHSGQDISADLIRFNPDLVVGYTTSPPNDTTLAKVPNGQRFIEVSRRVNEHNLKLPENQRFYKENVPAL